MKPWPEFIDDFCNKLMRKYHMAFYCENGLVFFKMPKINSLGDSFERYIINKTNEMPTEEFLNHYLGQYALHMQIKTDQYSTWFIDELDDILTIENAMRVFTDCGFEFIDYFWTLVIRDVNQIKRIYYGIKSYYEDTDVDSILKGHDRRKS